MLVEPVNKKIESSSITIEEFVSSAPEDLNLTVVSGAGGITERKISSPRIQKLGLALAGFTHYIHQGRVQIVGQSEILYLNQLSREKRLEAINNLSLDKISCILVTKNLETPSELIEITDQIKLPVLKTIRLSSTTIGTISNFLQEKLAPSTSLHSVLIGMYGLGVLLTGNSGIGKSECALDLITRGHRLISDDTVIVKKIGKKLEGYAPELTAGHIEIRGLGIINIRDLFGVSSVEPNRKIDLCIELRKWSESEEIERLGLKTREEEILEIKIPKFVLPVSSGRNISTLVETAVRMYLLKAAGFDAAQKLIEKHTAIVSGD
ncbi:MAG: HPr(Ser) kinase/phosphatase [Pyrinomonadaceae bacterium]